MKAITEEALQIVRGARKEEYGHPLDNFQRIADIWAVVFGHPVNKYQVALCMIGLKLARGVNNLGRDTLVDLAGYPQVIEDMQIEEERRKNE